MTDPSITYREDDLQDSAPPTLRAALYSLYNGAIEKSESPREWSLVLSNQGMVRAHLSAIGCALEINEFYGLAYLRALDDNGPCFLRKRPLGREASILAVLLRARQVEWDATGTGPLVLNITDLAAMLQPFINAGTNDALPVDRATTAAKALEGIKALRDLRARQGDFEVRRLLAILVPADKIDAVNRLLRDMVPEQKNPAVDDEVQHAR